MVAVVILGAGWNALSFAKGPDKEIDEINKLIEDEKQRMEALKKRLHAREKDLSVVGAKTSSVLKTLRMLNDELKLKERENRIYQWNLQSNQKQIATLKNGIEQAERQIDRQKNALSQRLRGMYKEGTLFPVKLMFSAENFSDLVQRIKYMESIAAYDASLFKRHEEHLKELKENKKSLEHARAKLEILEKATQEKQIEIQKAKTGKSRFLKELDRKKELSLKAREEILESSRNLDALINKLQEKLIRGEKLDVEDKKGRLHLPVNGKILNKFGRKRDTRYSTYVLYNGINIRAETGTPVRAVLPGKVLYADSLEGYGNLIILGHGEDYHSLYGHLDEILTEVGKAVREGQIIARTGDTGSLVGESLYFELRFKGSPIEPTQWFALAKR